MIGCRFCAKEYGKRTSWHEGVCKSNPNARKSTNQYIKAKQEGKVVEISPETKEKWSIANKKRLADPAARAQMAESVSKAVRKKVAEGTWHNSFSKARTHEYNGVQLYGRWELSYAKWLDANGIRWERPEKGFAYQWQGKTSHYFPDFYLPDQDLYVEIKGYPVQRDVEKWKSFKHNLSVLHGEELFEMGLINSFKPTNPEMNFRNILC